MERGKNQRGCSYWTQVLTVILCLCNTAVLTGFMVWMISVHNNGLQPLETIKHEVNKRQISGGIFPGRWYNGMIRLGGERIPRGRELTGILEVYVDRRWGPVCDDGLDPESLRKLGSVACADLGLYYKSGELRQRTNTDEFSLDNVYCNGTERNILQCSHDGAWRENCGRSEGVKITCTISVITRLGSNLEVQLKILSESFIKLDSTVTSLNETVRNLTKVVADLSYAVNGKTTAGSVRLDGARWPRFGQSYIAGVAEVNVHGRWGAICDDGVDYFDLYSIGTVLCGQMGLVYASGDTSRTTLSEHFALDEIYCNGSESNILDCRSNQPWVENCGRGEALWFNCSLPYSQGIGGTGTALPRRFLVSISDTFQDVFNKTNQLEKKIQRLENRNDGTTTVTDGSVRLGGQRKPSGTQLSGLLEVYLYGRWFTVCDDGLGSSHNLGEVVCRELGGTYEGTFRSALRTSNDDDFGLSSVKCRGDEENLLECSHKNRLRNDSRIADGCVHNDGAHDGISVTCNFTTGRRHPRMNGGLIYTEYGSNVCDTFDKLLYMGQWSKHDEHVTCNQITTQQIETYGWVVPWNDTTTVPLYYSTNQETTPAEATQTTPDKPWRTTTRRWINRTTPIANSRPITSRPWRYLPTTSVPWWWQRTTISTGWGTTTGVPWWWQRTSADPWWRTSAGPWRRTTMGRWETTTGRATSNTTGSEKDTYNSCVKCYTTSARSQFVIKFENSGRFISGKCPRGWHVKYYGYFEYNRCVRAHQSLKRNPDTDRIKCLLCFKTMN